METATADASSHGLAVGDVIRTQLYRIDASHTIGDAAAEFVRRDISCLLVDMDDGTVKLLSERALLKALLPSATELYGAERMPDATELEAIARDHADRAVSTAELVNAESVASTMPAMKALATMLASNYRRLLVTDASGALVGLVTEQDLTRTVLFHLHTAPA